MWFDNEVCGIVDMIVEVVLMASDLVCLVVNALACVVDLLGCVYLVSWVSRCIKEYSGGFNICS